MTKFFEVLAEEDGTDGGGGYDGEHDEGQFTGDDQHHRDTCDDGSQGASTIGEIPGDRVTYEMTVTAQPRDEIAGGGG